MLNVRLAALAVILAGGVLLARPAAGTYIPPTADSGEPLYCCCTKTLLGCGGDYCCSRVGCSISVNGCKLSQT